MNPAAHVSRTLPYVLRGGKRTLEEVGVAIARTGKPAVPLLPSRCPFLWA
jgi:hypothetical protein